MNGKKAKQQRRIEEAETGESTRIVAQLFRSSLNKLRQEFARRVRFGREKFPDMIVSPCKTCAFRTTADFTDGNLGFLETTVSLIAALDKGAAFYCHQEADEESRKVYGDNKYQPRRDEESGLLIPCDGWMFMHANAPEPLSARQLLGDTVVDLAVEGNKLFNEAKS